MGKEMTNKEAIRNLKKLRSFHNGSYGTAINMAIEALEILDNNTTILDEKSTKILLDIMEADKYEN